MAGNEDRDCVEVSRGVIGRRTYWMGRSAGAGRLFFVQIVILSPGRGPTRDEM